MSDPSITFWSRLEPRPRADDLANALAARVRDPAWFLARQWQLGEFDGEDAASPAYMKVASELSRMAAWAPKKGGGDPQGMSPDPSGSWPAMPIERSMLREPFSLDDVGTRVELGQRFERHLADHGEASEIPNYRQHYPIPEGTADDPMSARYRSVWQGRAIDGLALYQDLKSGTPPAYHPPNPSQGVLDALDEFRGGSRPTTEISEATTRPRGIRSCSGTRAGSSRRIRRAGPLLC
jgi:hypothetical protein